MVMSFFMLGCFLVIALYYIILGCSASRTPITFISGSSRFAFPVYDREHHCKGNIYPFNTLLDDRVDLVPALP